MVEVNRSNVQPFCFLRDNNSGVANTNEQSATMFRKRFIEGSDIS